MALPVETRLTPRRRPILRNSAVLCISEQTQQWWGQKRRNQHKTWTSSLALLHVQELVQNKSCTRPLSFLVAQILQCPDIICHSVQLSFVSIIAAHVPTGKLNMERLEHQP
jgi:hypothetical protein